MQAYYDKGEIDSMQEEHSMYKLFIVDDEPEVTEGLKEAINWPEYNIAEVYTAINGKEAIECFERIEPDIVVTDISMPYMNGLQLTEWIRNHYPLTKVVIISGYDDFQFAKQAIHLQVEEYLLKPFSNEQLLDSILKVIDTINRERQELTNIQALQEHYRTSLPLLREKFLASLLTRRLPSHMIAQRLQNYQLQLLGKAYIVSLISIVHDDVEHEQSFSLVDSQDIDLKLFAVSNIATEVWQSEHMGKVFIHQDEVVVLTIAQDDNKQHAMNKTVACLKKILQSVQRYLRMSALISVGSYVERIEQLKFSYDSAYSGLDYRRIMDHNAIICIDDLEQASPSRLVFDEYKEQQFVRALKLGTEKELQEVLAVLLGDIEQSQATVSEYEQYFLEMITTIHRLMKSLDALEAKQWGDSLQLFMQYQERKSLEATKRWFTELCIQLQQAIAQTRQFASQRLVEEAIEYTKQHFSQHELSVTTLCQQLHISPGYFSGIFKKATGITYGAYIQKIRMETAQELLATTDMKAFEIAERVGFVDANYFSLSFKKYTGVSAKEYRNGLIRKE